MKCEEVREMVPAYIDEPDLTLSVRRHLSRCDDCHRELAQYESLLDGLADLRATAVEPPPTLARALSAIPSQTRPFDQVVGHFARNRRAYAGALVALLGATGAVALRSRRQRLAPA